MELPPALPFLRLQKDDGVILDLHVQPNAARTAVQGMHDGALRLRLHAPPVEGKANQALIAWLADTLRIPKAAIELVRGASGRRKQVRIDGRHAARANWSALQTMPRDDAP